METQLLLHVYLGCKLPGLYLCAAVCAHSGLTLSQCEPCQSCWNLQRLGISFYEFMEEVLIQAEPP